MTTNYYAPVAISDTPVHGDFAMYDSNASVLRVKNLRVIKWPEVVKCIDPELFITEVGFPHTPEAYIRSYLHLFTSLEYDVEKVSWIHENSVCQTAFEEAHATREKQMTWEHSSDESNMFKKSDTEHYEFILPHELVFPVPVDLDATEYVCLEKYPEAYQDVLQTLAWRYLITTLPIYDIKVVPNAQEDSEDPELLKLEQLMSHVNATVDDLMTELSTGIENIDYSKYDISIELNGVRTCLGNGAKEYNGLQSYIEYMISEL